jgi:co-chaperonin GroES (HSP10)
MKYHPILHYMVIEIEVPDERTASGLYVPISSRERKMNEGEIGRVVEMGPQAYKAFHDGSPQVKVGDRVFCKKHAGVSPPENPMIRVLNDEDILCRVDEEMVQVQVDTEVTP